MLDKLIESLINTVNVNEDKDIHEIIRDWQIDNSNLIIEADLILEDWEEIGDAISQCNKKCEEWKNNFLSNWYNNDSFENWGSDPLGTYENLTAKKEIHDSYKLIYKNLYELMSPGNDIDNTILVWQISNAEAIKKANLSLEDWRNIADIVTVESDYEWDDNEDIWASDRFNVWTNDPDGTLEKLNAEKEHHIT